jgi:hypothetical protein
MVIACSLGLSKISIPSIIIGMINANNYSYQNHLRYRVREVVFVLIIFQENLVGNWFTIPSTTSVSDIILTSWRTLSYAVMSAI